LGHETAVGTADAGDCAGHRRCARRSSGRGGQARPASRVGHREKMCRWAGSRPFSI